MIVMSVQMAVVVVAVIVKVNVAAGVLLVSWKGHCMAGSCQSRHVFSLGEYSMGIHIAIVVRQIIDRVPGLGFPGLRIVCTIPRTFPWLL